MNLGCYIATKGLRKEEIELLLIYWKHLDELDNFESWRMRKGKQDRDKIIQSRANKLYIHYLNMQWSGERYLQ